MAANNERVLNGLSPLIVVSADRELNDAAQAEGFFVEDPITIRKDNPGRLDLLRRFQHER